MFSLAIYGPKALSISFTKIGLSFNTRTYVFSASACMLFVWPTLAKHFLFATCIRCTTSSCKFMVSTSLELTLFFWVSRDGSGNVFMQVQLAVLHNSDGAWRVTIQIWRKASDAWIRHENHLSADASFYHWPVVWPAARTLFSARQQKPLVQLLQTYINSCTDHRKDTRRLLIDL